MEHLAMPEGADDPNRSTIWLAHGTDDEYTAR